MSIAGVDALLTAAAAAEVPNPDAVMIAEAEKCDARSRMMTSTGDFSEWLLSVGTKERNKWIVKARLSSVEQVDLLTKTRRFKQRLSKKKQTDRKKATRDKVQTIAPDYVAAAKRAQATIDAQKAFAEKLKSEETSGVEGSSKAVGSDTDGGNTAASPSPAIMQIDPPATP